MTVNLNDKGLKDIIKDFDLFYIDIWGVLHNGIKLNDSAVHVLSKLDELNPLIHHQSEGESPLSREP